MLNIILQEAQRWSFANEELLQKTFQKWTNVHRTTEALEFLRACIFQKVSPRFVRVPPNEVKSLGINSQEQKNIENRKLLYERNEKCRSLDILRHEFAILSNEILSICNNSIIHFKFINFIKIITKKFEFRSDERRSRKFDKLVETRDLNFNTANVHNRTDIEIPPKVLDLLQLGKNRGVGAPFRDDSTNILEIDKLFHTFENIARKNNISELLIAKIKGLSIMSGLDIQSCTTDDSRVTELKNFLKKYPQNILLQVDKSPDLIYVRKLDYIEKIKNFL